MCNDSVEWSAANTGPKHSGRPLSRPWSERPEHGYQTSSPAGRPFQTLTVTVTVTRKNVAGIDVPPEVATNRPVGSKDCHFTAEPTLPKMCL
jgi:hypothetical protein